MMLLILQKIRNAYQDKKDRSLFRQKHEKIFGLERKRAKKANWHQLTLTLQEFEAQTQQLVDDLSEPLENHVMRWPPPVYRPLFSATPAIIISPPSQTKTIPPHLRRAFPFPFMPERVFDHGECCSNMCPVRGLHLAGLYYRDRKGAYVMGPRTEWFGDSEAPPDVWDAVMRLEAENYDESLDQDVAMVRDFRRCHYYTFQEQGEMRYKEVVRYASAAYKDALEICKIQKRAGAGAGADATVTVGYALGALAGAGANLAATGLASATAAGDDADTIVDADADADAFADADTIVDAVDVADADAFVDADAFADADAGAGVTADDALLALATAAADLADLGVASTIAVGVANAPAAGGDDAAGVAVADAALVDADGFADGDVFFDADAFIAADVAAAGAAADVAGDVAGDVTVDIAADITASASTSVASTPILTVSYEDWIWDFD